METLTCIVLLHTYTSRLLYKASTQKVKCINSHFIVLLSGTEEERIAVETASRYGSKPDTYSSPIAEDISIEVTMDGEGPRMGGDAELNIVMRNASSLPRTINLHSQVAVMYYTGVLKATVKKDETPVELLANEGEPMNILY